MAVNPAAAASCSLSAPETVMVGAQLTVLGSGFPASTSIDISIGLQDRPPDEFPVQSDSAGGFRISFTPEAADAGETTILATAGSTCSAHAIVVVNAATITPTSQATSAPGRAGAGATGNPPRTDAVAQPIDQTGLSPSIGWVFALVVLLMGMARILSGRKAAGL